MHILFEKLFFLVGDFVRGFLGFLWFSKGSLLVLYWFSTGRGRQCLVLHFFFHQSRVLLGMPV